MAQPAIIMLDTNIASYAMRDQSPALKAHIRNAPVHALCISAITQAELQYGAALHPENTRLANAVALFLRSVETLAWDSDVAQHYGQLRAELKKAGTPLAPMDLLIAAHALSVGALLITNDAAFRHVAGLKTEDWINSNRF